MKSSLNDGDRDCDCDRNYISEIEGSKNYGLSTIRRVGASWRALASSAQHVGGFQRCLALLLRTFVFFYFLISKFRSNLRDMSMSTIRRVGASWRALASSAQHVGGFQRCLADFNC